MTGQDITGSRQNRMFVSVEELLGISTGLSDLRVGEIL